MDPERPREDRGGDFDGEGEQRGGAVLPRLDPDLVEAPARLVTDGGDLLCVEDQPQSRDAVRGRQRVVVEETPGVGPVFLAVDGAERAKATSGRSEFVNASWNGASSVRMAPLASPKRLRTCWSRRITGRGG